MKTKPFNLEEALAGAKVVTRSGEEVSQLTLFKDVKNDYPLLGVIGKDLESFRINGDYSKRYESTFDLFLVVETKKVYVNIFEGKNGNLFVAPQYFKDRKTAIINKNNFEGVNSKYIKTIEITDEP